MEIRTHAAGLNFSDVMKALNLYPGLPDGPIPLGIECAGVITQTGRMVKDFRPGDRVAALAPFCFGNYVDANKKHVVLIPGNMSFEEAATIPVAFLTAFYALMLSIATGRHWRAVTHVLSTRRRREVPLDAERLESLWEASERLEALSAIQAVPRAQRIPLCETCSLACFCGYD